MRRNAWVAPALCVGMLLAVGAQPLLAQRISLAPNIGVYIPTTELVKAASGEEFKQEVSIRSVAAWVSSSPNASV